MTDWRKEFRKRFVTKINGFKVVAAKCETSKKTGYPEFSYWDPKDLEAYIDRLLSEQREEADQIILDAWEQFAYVSQTKGRWSGGLSTLEEIESYLKERKIPLNGSVLRKHDSSK